MKVYLKRKLIEPSYKPCQGCYFEFKDNECDNRNDMVCVDEINDYIFVQVKHKEKAE